jgi:hypothetical protein
MKIKNYLKEFIKRDEKRIKKAKKEFFVFLSNIIMTIGIFIILYYSTTGFKIGLTFFLTGFCIYRWQI